MREQKRIDEITNLFNKVWKQYPDLRLWQIQGLITEYIPQDKLNEDPFFWEEDVWKKILESMLSEVSK